MKLIQFWICTCTYNNREANSCADILVGMGCTHQYGLVVYEQALVQLGQALLSDVIGVPTRRRTLV